MNEPARYGLTGNGSPTGLSEPAPRPSLPHAPWCGSGLAPQSASPQQPLEHDPRLDSSRVGAGTSPSGTTLTAEVPGVIITVGVTSR
jgi:hypothetical protein